MISTLSASTFTSSSIITSNNPTLTPNESSTISSIITKNSPTLTPNESSTITS